MLLGHKQKALHFFLDQPLTMFYPLPIHTEVFVLENLSQFQNNLGMKDGRTHSCEYPKKNKKNNKCLKQNIIN